MEKLYQKLNLISKWYYSYQTSGIWVRHKWHECGTSATQVRLSDTSATRVRISARRTTRVRHERKINYTSENIFSHPCISYMANERLQREEQFHSKNYLLEMPCHHAKMSLKSLNFVMAKLYQKLFARL